MRLALILFSVLLLLGACDESSVSVFSTGYLEFDESVSDSLMIYMDNENTELKFTGNLNLVYGKCDLLLISAKTEIDMNTFYTYDYDTIYFIDEINTDTVEVDGNYVVHVDTSWAIGEIFIADSIVNVDTLYFYNDSIYFQSFNAPVEIDFEEYFEAIEGYWRFYIDIYALEKESEIFGDLDFAFQYNN